MQHSSEESSSSIAVVSFGAFTWFQGSLTIGHDISSFGEDGKGSKPRLKTLFLGLQLPGQLIRTSSFGLVFKSGTGGIMIEGWISPEPCKHH